MWIVIPSPIYGFSGLQGSADKLNTDWLVTQTPKWSRCRYASPWTIQNAKLRNKPICLKSAADISKADLPTETNIRCQPTYNICYLFLYIHVYMYRMTCFWNLLSFYIRYGNYRGTNFTLIAYRNTIFLLCSGMGLPPSPPLGRMGREAWV